MPNTTPRRTPSPSRLPLTEKLAISPTRRRAADADRPIPEKIAKMLNGVLEEASGDNLMDKLEEIGSRGYEGFDVVNDINPHYISIRENLKKENYQISKKNKRIRAYNDQNPNDPIPEIPLKTTDSSKLFTEDLKKWVDQKKQENSSVVIEVMQAEKDTLSSFLNELSKEKKIIRDTFDSVIAGDNLSLVAVNGAIGVYDSKAEALEERELRQGNLSERMAILKYKISKTAAELTKLGAGLAELGSNAEDAISLESDISDLIVNLNTLNDESTELRTEIADKKTEVEKLLEQVTEKTASLETSKESLDEIEFSSDIDGVSSETTLDEPENYITEINRISAAGDGLVNPVDEKDLKVDSVADGNLVYSEFQELNGNIQGFNAQVDTRKAEIDDQIAKIKADLNSSVYTKLHGDLESKKAEFQRIAGDFEKQNDSASTALGNIQDGIDASNNTEELNKIREENDKKIEELQKLQDEITKQKKTLKAQLDGNNGNNISSVVRAATAPEKNLLNDEQQGEIQELYNGLQASIDRLDRLEAIDIAQTISEIEQQNAKIDTRVAEIKEQKQREAEEQRQREAAAAEVENTLTGIEDGLNELTKERAKIQQDFDSVTTGGVLSLKTINDTIGTGKETNVPKEEDKKVWVRAKKLKGEIQQELEKLKAIKESDDYKQLSEVEKTRLDERIAELNTGLDALDGVVGNLRGVIKAKKAEIESLMEYKAEKTASLETSKKSLDEIEFSSNIDGVSSETTLDEPENYITEINRISAAGDGLVNPVDEKDLKVDSVADGNLVYSEFQELNGNIQGFNAQVDTRKAEIDDQIAKIKADLNNSVYEKLAGDLGLEAVRVQGIANGFSRNINELSALDEVQINKDVASKSLEEKQDEINNRDAKLKDLQDRIVREKTELLNRLSEGNNSIHGVIAAANTLSEDRNLFDGGDAVGQGYNSLEIQINKLDELTTNITELQNRNQELGTQISNELTRRQQEEQREREELEQLKRGMQNSIAGLLEELESSNKEHDSIRNDYDTLIGAENPSLAQINEELFTNQTDNEPLANRLSSAANGLAGIKGRLNVLKDKRVGEISFDEVDKKFGEVEGKSDKLNNDVEAKRGEVESLLRERDELQASFEEQVNTFNSTEIPTPAQTLEDGHNKGFDEYKERLTQANEYIKSVRNGVESLKKQISRIDKLKVSDDLIKYSEGKELERGRLDFRGAVGRKLVGANESIEKIKKAYSEEFLANLKQERDDVAASINETRGNAEKLTGELITEIPENATAEELERIRESNKDTLDKIKKLKETFNKEQEELKAKVEKIKEIQALLTENFSADDDIQAIEALLEEIVELVREELDIDIPSLDRFNKELDERINELSELEMAVDNIEIPEESFSSEEILAEIKKCTIPQFLELAEATIADREKQKNNIHFRVLEGDIYTKHGPESKPYNCGIVHSSESNKGVVTLYMDSDTMAKKYQEYQNLLSDINDRFSKKEITKDEYERLAGERTNVFKESLKSVGKTERGIRNNQYVDEAGIRQKEPNIVIGKGDIASLGTTLDEDGNSLAFRITLDENGNPVLLNNYFVIDKDGKGSAHPIDDKFLKSLNKSNYKIEVNGKSFEVSGEKLVEIYQAMGSQGLGASARVSFEDYDVEVRGASRASEVEAAQEALKPSDKVREAVEGFEASLLGTLGSLSADEREKVIDDMGTPKEIKLNINSYLESVLGRNSPSVDGVGDEEVANSLGEMKKKVEEFEAKLHEALGSLSADEREKAINDVVESMKISDDKKEKVKLGVNSYLESVLSKQERRLAEEVRAAPEAATEQAAVTATGAEPVQPAEAEAEQAAVTEPGAATETEVVPEQSAVTTPEQPAVATTEQPAVAEPGQLRDKNGNPAPREVVKQIVEAAGPIVERGGNIINSGEASPAKTPAAPAVVGPAVGQGMGG